MNEYSNLDAIVSTGRFGSISIGCDVDHVRRLVGEVVFNQGWYTDSFDGKVKYGVLDADDISFQFAVDDSEVFRLFLISILPRKETYDFNGAGVFEFDGEGLYVGMSLTEARRVLGRFKPRVLRGRNVSDSTSTYSMNRGIAFIFSSRWVGSVKRLYSIEVTESESAGERA